MNCLLLTRYGSLAASSRLRFCQYVPYLHSQGIQVEVAPLLDNSYVAALYSKRPVEWSSILRAYWNRLRDLRRASLFDLVWIEAELFPWLPSWSEIWLNQKVPCVVDYDDAAFHRYDLLARLPIRWLMGNKIDVVMRRAAMVIAGNDYLAQRARRAGATRVEILPTVVDLNRYFPAVPRSSSEFVVGWIGSPATTRYLDLLEEALRELGNSSNVLLRTCGTDPIQWRGVRSDAVAWSEATEVGTLHSFDTGVMPLPDTPWARGKCGYKLIQYMACALPVVASPVGANRQIVREAVNGLLAGSAGEWVKALSFLRDHPEVRVEMGQAGRRDVIERYCLQVTAPRLSQLLRETANR